MPFQNTVRADMGAGIPGELSTSGPQRVAPWILRSENPNVIGYAYTFLMDGVAQVGGKGKFAGILVHPKRYASYGTPEGPLAPTLELPNESVGELLTMGEIFVSLSPPTEVGYVVMYDMATGALSAIAADKEASEGKAIVPNAVVSRYGSTAYKPSDSELTVITLTN
ncbi:hypothetical protein [Mycoavidus sp. SF9855]|uniref:structural cement protein Gp24 n=1 Tax=Mycoavidus sp. SF9855 TaxID=2968475 RepID=UPI00211D0679|nr:hypothetical protein [Mycoavidus sp. SF9855]UUM20940.1 hypothetical protein NQD60_05510 [Mycoavidus sp. SF9855]